MTEATATPTTVTETFDGVMENAYGKALDTAITFEGSFERVTVFEAIPPKELPDNDDVLTLVNNKRKANARQKAMQAALDAAGVKKPTLEGDVDLQVKTIAKGLAASGKYTEDQATALAKQMLGLS